MELTAEDFIYANGVPMSPEQAAEQANSFIGLTPKNIILSKPVGTVYRVGLGGQRPTPKGAGLKAKA